MGTAPGGELPKACLPGSIIPSPGSRHGKTSGLRPLHTPAIYQPDPDIFEKNNKREVTAPTIKLAQKTQLGPRRLRVAGNRCSPPGNSFHSQMINRQCQLILSETAKA